MIFENIDLTVLCVLRVSKDADVSKILSVLFSDPNLSCLLNAVCFLAITLLNTSGLILRRGKKKAWCI